MNLDIINTLEILHATQQDKYLILNKEKQLCRYTLHQELLTNCKGNRKYPKGIRLKFNLSLCLGSPELQRHCKRVPRNTSLKLRGIIFKTVELKVKEISKDPDLLRKKILNLETFKTMFQEELKILSRDITYRHQKRYKGGNISAVESNQKNIRFRRGKH